MKKIFSLILSVLLVTFFLSLPAAAKNTDKSGTYSGTIKITNYNESYILSTYLPEDQQAMDRAQTDENREIIEVQAKHTRKMIVEGLKKIVNTDTSFTIKIWKNDMPNEASGDYIADTVNSSFSSGYFRCLPTTPNYQKAGYWAQYNDQRYGQTTVSITGSSINLTNKTTLDDSEVVEYNLSGKISGKKISGTWSQKWEGTEAVRGTFTVTRTSDSGETASVTNQTVNSNASSTSGETKVTVASIIVVAAAGLIASVIAAGGAGKSESEEEKKRSTYRMGVKKDFGDTIKYGFSASVYARMIEVTPDGEGIDRPDLSQKISISSESPLIEVGSGTFSGIYTEAVVSASESSKASMGGEAVISFIFEGEGGTFQNNITFKVLGESYIEVEEGKIYVLAASGKSTVKPYKLVNFTNKADVTVNKPQNSPFDIEASITEDGRTVLTVTDHSGNKPFDGFYEDFTCEITAQNEKEYARTVFTVVLCQEGLQPDFLGKPKEICAYKESDEKMKETLVAFRIGVWNDASGKLEFIKPDGIDISCEDEEGIFEVIGLDYELDTNAPSDDSVRYIFSAKISLPAKEPIKGTLSASCVYGGKTYSNETDIKMIPDVQQYEKDFEEEYKKCHYIIRTYMPEPFCQRKLVELEKSKNNLGLKDLQIFRENVWKFASILIMQEKQKYLIDSYWYDEAIAAAEVMVYIGDVALDAALAPFGGPIAGFVIGQVKGSLIDIISMRCEKGSLSFNDIWEFIGKRWQQMAGQLDGAFEVPKPEEVKKLVAWLACYFLYRFVYHWWYDQDDDGKPKGLSAAIDSAVQDFIGKNASIILGEFTKKVAKENGWDKFSIADADQEITNKAVTNAAKTGLDIGDKAASKLDTLINDSVKTLLDFLNKIKSGLFTG